MLTLNSEKFLRLLRQLHDLAGIVIGIRSEESNKKAEINFTVDSTMRQDANEIVVLLGELALPMSLAEAKKLRTLFEKDSVEADNLKQKKRGPARAVCVYFFLLRFLSCFPCPNCFWRA